MALFEVQSLDRADAARLHGPRSGLLVHLQMNHSLIQIRSGGKEGHSLGVRPLFETRGSRMEPGKVVDWEKEG